MTVHDIKDRSPNQALIDLLEKQLELAKSGELRSAIIVNGFNDDSVEHVWAIDRRSSWRMLLSELVILQHSFTVNIELRDGDSVLAMALQDS